MGSICVYIVVFYNSFVREVVLFFCFVEKKIEFSWCVVGFFIREEGLFLCLGV